MSPGPPSTAPSIRRPGPPYNDYAVRWWAAPAIWLGVPNQFWATPAAMRSIPLSVAGAFVSQRLRPLPSRQNRRELLAVTTLIEDGKLTPVVDRTYPLADTVEGLRHVEQGHARGKAVVTVA
jgi:NADPH:quinone reductase-like Zn-dependent oxidoreductase